MISAFRRILRARPVSATRDSLSTGTHFPSTCDADMRQTLTVKSVTVIECLSVMQTRALPLRVAFGWRSAFSAAILGCPMNRGFSLWGILCTQEMPKEPIPQLARRRLDANVLLRRMLRDITAVRMKLQVVHMRQIRHEPLIRIRLSPAQFVIEMNNRKDNPEFAPQLQQHPQ